MVIIIVSGHLNLASKKCCCFYNFIQNWSSKSDGDCICSWFHTSILDLRYERKQLSNNWFFNSPGCLSVWMIESFVICFYDLMTAMKGDSSIKFTIQLIDENKPLFADGIFATCIWCDLDECRVCATSILQIFFFRSSAFD